MNSFSELVHEFRRMFGIRSINPLPFRFPPCYWKLERQRQTLDWEWQVWKSGYYGPSKNERERCTGFLLMFICNFTYERRWSEVFQYLEGDSLLAGNVGKCWTVLTVYECNCWLVFSEWCADFFLVQTDVVVKSKSDNLTLHHTFLGQSISWYFQTPR